MSPSQVFDTIIPPDLDDKQKFSNLKKNLIKPENVEKVKDSWNRLLVALEKKTDEIKSEGSNYIPSINWDDIKKEGKVPDNIGVVVVV